MDGIVLLDNAPCLARDFFEHPWMEQSGIVGAFHG